MFRRHIWIASHFHSTRRMQFIRSTIQSIQNQITPPDQIILSFSLQHDLVERKAEICDDLKMCTTIPFTILYQPTRLYQFEHLHKIFEHMLASTDEKDRESLYISFCDDDDFLHEHFISTTNDFIEQGYDKIQCRFYQVGEDATYHDRYHNSTIGKYCEFGGMTCSWGYFQEFLQSPFYRPLDCHCDLYCACFTGDFHPKKAVRLSTPLYYYRQGLYSAHHKIWSFPRDITDSTAYARLLEDTQDLLPEIRDHVISMWLYDAKLGDDHNTDRRLFIERTIRSYHEQNKALKSSL